MKHIKVALCICAVVVVALMPFTAFGAVTEYNNNYRWSDIITDNNINLGESYVICRDTNGYYYIVTQNSTSNGGVQNLNCNSSNIADVTQLSGRDYYLITGGTQQWSIYKSSNAYNPYGTYEHSTSYGHSPLVVNVESILANSLDIKNNGTSVFLATPYGTYQETTTGDSTTPETSPTQTETSLRVSGVIQSGTLQGVLIEVISILPILVPVLVAFIAIRKGISFVLATLRTS